MALRFADLWSWGGRVDRKTYALVGFLAFLIKRILDAAVTSYFFHVNTGIFYYWAPLGGAVRIDRLSSFHSEYVATLLLLAMPFLWIGLAMTVRRLRDAGQPVWVVVLFFVPVVNVLFFLALCALPPKERAVTAEAAPWPGPRALDRIVPRDKAGSAILAIVLTSLIGLIFLLMGTVVLRTYGWSLFVALPFCLGLFSVLLYSYHAPRSFGSCMQVSLLPVGILGLAIIAVAMEGLICVLMAAPLALVLAALGGMLGYHIQANHWRASSPSMLAMVLLVVPALFGMERAAALQPPAFAVRTSIEVKASQEAVWQQVVAFTEIPPPTELLFRAGVAYPIRAEISGRGPGAIRRCIFSTGPFVEPIEVWDEPRLLKFGVTENPAPLNELTPYGHIDPPHLHGYFVSQEGQFVLTPLPGGGTRLEGTTWYRDAMWPAAYWHLWSDYIIHRIHLRVLNHIRERAESSQPADPQ